MYLTIDGLYWRCKERKKNNKFDKQWKKEKEKKNRIKIR